MAREIRRSGETNDGEDLENDGGDTRGKSQGWHFYENL